MLEVDECWLIVCSVKHKEPDHIDRAGMPIPAFIACLGS